jgi:hypothetical protein
MSRYLFHALAVLPALAAVALVATHGVNVPFWDQWELLPILAKQQAGTLAFADLMEQHNEHRMLAPYAVMVWLAPLTGWNILVELWVNVGLAAVALGLAFFMLRPSLSGAGPRFQGAVLALLSLTVFTLAQWENWLWGWQIQWFLSLAATLGCAWALNAGLGAGTRAVALGLTAVAGLLAGTTQMSLAGGVMLWPLGLAVVLLHPGPHRRAAAAVWLIAAAASCFLFFHGWHSAPIPGMPTPMEALADPVKLIKYALTYLGGPITRMKLVDLPYGAAGAGLLAVFAVASAVVLIARWENRAQWLPWGMLAGYAVGCAFVTGLGRVGFGVEQATGSRYVTLSLLLTLSVIAVTAQALRSAPDSRMWGRAGAGAAVVLAVLLALGDVKSFEGVAARHGQLTAGLACLRDLAAAPDACIVANLYPDASVVRTREPMLRALDWSGYK